jgi:hypothetical protein
MTAKEYSKKYDMALNFKIVAERAFNAGLKAGREKNKTDKAKATERELKKVKAELKSLWKTLEDPEECGRLLAGM